MNLFDGKFDLIDVTHVSDNKYKVTGKFVDNTGTYTINDAKVGDIIYLDGSTTDFGLLRFKIVELHNSEFHDSVLSATIDWDMIPEISPVAPIPGMEGIIGAVHTNGLTANITAYAVNGANEIVISKANCYQNMLLGSNNNVDFSTIEKEIETIEQKLASVQLEWENNMLSTSLEIE